jgi:ATP-dependent Lon protease
VLRPGLAWTPVGGDILFIEATSMPGKGKLILTGQLGEVMKESAQAAFSLVKTRAEGWVLVPSTFRKTRSARTPAGRRDPQGRPECRRGPVHGYRVAADRPQSAQ